MLTPTPGLAHGSWHGLIAGSPGVRESGSRCYGLSLQKTRFASSKFSDVQVEVFLLRDPQQDGCRCSTITVVSSSLIHVLRHWPRGTERKPICACIDTKLSFLLVAIPENCEWDGTPRTQRGNDDGDADGRAGACEARTQWTPQLRLDRESGFRAAWRGYPFDDSQGRECARAACLLGDCFGAMRMRYSCTPIVETE